ncbi:UNKNOWN [Stylonychia lemnae]|uniref:Uncharacterized protein n=1 Tax=Stylonychia lemnae TaxID=5949 RepID=A0A078ACD3_STYLE|nr:UNKNOWN [Stylonychia lemnae]|eukprot:CDW79915.1 UNKNOWN [Stylonychia lemnae]
MVDDPDKQPVIIKNDIREIRTIKQLYKVDLDFESPRMKKAMFNLGVSQEECIKKEREDFVKRGLDEDVINLRFKHHQYSLIDTLNRILEERRRISNLHLHPQIKKQFINFPLLINVEMEIQREEIRLGNNTSSPNGLKKKATFISPQTQIKPTKMSVDEKAINSLQIPNLKEKLGGITSMNNSIINASTQFGSMPQSTLNKTSPGFFMTGMPMEDSFEFEVVRQQKGQKRTQQSVLLKVKDEYERVEKLKQLGDKLTKAEKQFKDLTKQKHITHSLNTSKKRDEKIQLIKKEMEFKAKQFTERENGRLMKEQAELEKRLKELEDRKYHEQRQRELQYKQKRDQLMKMSIDQEFEEKQELVVRLMSLETRINRGEEKFRQTIEEKVTRLHEKNEDMMGRRLKVREKNTNEWDNLIQSFTEKELKNFKRFQSLQRDINKVMNAQKNKRKEIFDNQTSRKADEEYNRQRKLDHMLQKLNRSEKAVKEFLSDQKHNLMLKQEERKLKEEDMKKIRLRMKRLEFKKKMEIIEKEKSVEQIIEQVKEREKEIIQKRYENCVKLNFEKEQLKRTMHIWAHSGFTPDKSPEKNVTLNINNSIVDFKQTLFSTSNLKKKKNKNDDTNP